MSKKFIQVISNTSLHKEVPFKDKPSSAYIGWLLNQEKNGVVYFIDDYGGKWKLQRLSDTHVKLYTKRLGSKVQR